MRERSEIDGLRADTEGLKERMAGVEQAQQALLRQFGQLRDAAEARDREIRGQMTGLERSLKADGAAARADLKKEVVDRLTAKVAELMRPQPAAGGRRVEKGREHTVRPGETLSEIAAAYGVTVGTIVRANNLTDANRVRAGTTLFIPD
jgi:nucleoid-associated protein YgaU